MPFEYRDSVSDTSLTTGTGTLTLTGATATGFRSFASAGFTTGSTVRYRIASADGAQWEVGMGVWTAAGSTLSRTRVYASSNAGALVSFSAGPKAVTNVSTAADFNKAAVFVTMTGTLFTTPSGVQKVPLNNLVRDATGIWNANNTRIIPDVEGWYWVSVNLRITASAPFYAAISKNGGFLVVGTESAGTSAGGSQLVYFNGTTDYVEASTYILSTRAYDNNSPENNMSLYGPV